MATVAPVIVKSEIKADKTWNVKIRVSHNSGTRYIETAYFVDKTQVDKKNIVKDPLLLEKLNPSLKRYRMLIGDMSMFIDNLTVTEVRARLTADDKKSEGIEFISFCNSHIKALKENGKTGSTPTLQAVVNDLTDIFPSGKCVIDQINYKFLLEYEKHLKTPRTVKRKNSKGILADTFCKGVNKSGLHNRMRDLRLMFNAAKEKYNDEDTGEISIKHSPFSKYKVGKQPKGKKRWHTIEEIARIRDCKPITSLGLQAQQFYMLSFCMCGVNAVDIFRLPSMPKSRLEFNRSKTSDRREDDAFISIKIIPEAKGHLEVFAGKISKRYKDHLAFDRALSMGCRELERLTDIDWIKPYHAREDMANIARNDCRFSKDDISLMLNHIDQGLKTTDIYLAKDWSIIDDVQAAVVKLLNETKQPE